ncbi:hypothetical protein KEJ27_00905 [Candidatus Bathyarchaeota archaeon]|nr:hypothetical protein [Candidatus Bathyarchaeota archaeon]MBS7614085.1 hypothetical protein [Candidatus Bathyarchaeota archaeon]MBS7617395.1 hypothetical protein [Candidatus Bathyarchaeota archaeon]
MLQRVIDEMWKNVTWKGEQIKGKRRLIPIIPKENDFKHHYLRSFLMETGAILSTMWIRP